MKNIGKNYIFTLFFYLNLTRGVWMIYLAYRGFSLLELGIFEGVFHITSFLMEVPTGVVADLWGRKNKPFMRKNNVFSESFNNVLFRQFHSPGCRFRVLRDRLQP